MFVAGGSCIQLKGINYYGAGQKSIRPYWRNYFQETDALVRSYMKVYRSNSC